MEEQFTKGCEEFDAMDYFEAHETWEALWMEATGARHAFLQCLIQVAVALHHASNGNLNGSRKLLSRSLSYLEKGRADSCPVDLDVLKDRILEFELGIQSREKGQNVELPYFKLPYRDERVK